MRLFGSIALLHALPPHVNPISVAAVGNVGDLAPDIKYPPTYYNSGTAGTSASAASISPTLPSSRPVGNLLVALCQIIGSGKTFSVGGGWTIGDTSADGAACWAWRYVDGAEAAPVFSWSGAVACSSQVTQWTTVKTTGAIGASGKASGSGTTVSLSGIVTGVDLSRALAFVCAQTSQTIPTASGFSLHQTQANARGSYAIESQGVPSAAASGSISSTISSAAWEAFLIEIKRA